MDFARNEGNVALLSLWLESTDGKRTRACINLLLPGKTFAGFMLD